MQYLLWDHLEAGIHISVNVLPVLCPRFWVFQRHLKHECYFNRLTHSSLENLLKYPVWSYSNHLVFFSSIKPNFKKSFLAYKTSQVTHWLEHSGAHVCKKILDKVKQTSTGRPKQPGTKIIFVKPTCNMVQSALQCHLSPAKVEVISVRRKRSRYSKTTRKNWGTTHSDILLLMWFFFF